MPHGEDQEVSRGSLCSFSLADLFVRQEIFYYSLLADVQELLFAEGQKVDYRGEWGTLSLGRGFPTERSYQDKARLSIEISSSCMRANWANSIKHNPRAWASPANKVIFPNLLRQKGDTLPSLCWAHRAGRIQAWAGLTLCCPSTSPVSAKSLGFSSALPSPWRERSTGCRSWHWSGVRLWCLRRCRENIPEEGWGKRVLWPKIHWDGSSYWGSRSVGLTLWFPRPVQ